MRKLFSTVLLLSSMSLAAQDLIITDISFDSTYYKYSLFRGQVTVKNQGILSTHATNAKIYLTNVDSINESYVGNVSIPALEPDEVLVTSIDPYIIRLDTGLYTIVVDIWSHPNENETNTDNNRYIGTKANVLETDLDLVITSMTTETTVFELGNLTVNYSVDDLGEKSNIGGMYISLYFSEDEVLDANDFQIGVGYARGDYSSEFADSETFTLPSSIIAGNYYPILYADTVFASSYYDEVNETNNVYIGNQIEVIEADIDLSVSNIYASGDYSFLAISFTLTNNGTTDVGNYKLDYYLSSDDSLDVYDRPISYSYNYANEVVPAGSSINMDDFYEVGTEGFLPSGDHYLILAYTDSTTGLPLIEPVVSPMFTVEEYSLQFDIDSIWTTYQLYSGTEVIPFNFQIFNNTGNHIHGFWAEYDFTIKNSEERIVYSGREIDLIYLNDSSTRIESYEFQLDSALAAGQYVATVSYQDWMGASATFGSFSALIEVKDSIFSIQSNFIGNSNEVISKGKVYLYRDIGQDSTWVQDTIISVVDEIGNSVFFEGEDDYTIYVIPDPDLYPNYLPTILGNTFKLTETSFTRISADTIFSITPIYVPALDSMGVQTIAGQVSKSSSQNGRVEESAEGVQIYLLNNLGEVIAVTTTDSNGYYSFVNLEPGEYSIYINDGEILLPNDVEVEVQLVDGVDEIVLSTDLSEPDSTEITLYDYNFSIDSLSFQQSVKSLDDTVSIRLNIRGNAISPIGNLQAHFILKFSSPSNLSEQFVYDTIVSLSLNEFIIIDIDIAKPLWVNGNEANYTLSASYKTKYSNEEQSLISKVFVVDMINAVNTGLDDGISYYPNPFKKSIQVISPFDVNEILLLTLKGESIPIGINRNDKGNLEIIPLNNLPNGNYILRLKVNNKIKSFKVLKSE